MPLTKKPVVHECYDEIVFINPKVNTFSPKQKIIQPNLMEILNKVPEGVVKPLEFSEEPMIEEDNDNKEVEVDAYIIWKINPSMKI